MHPLLFGILPFTLLLGACHQTADRNPVRIDKLIPTTNGAYVVDTLTEGTPLYTDRPYTVGRPPRGLAGSTFIRTPNNAKHVKTSTVMSIRLKESARVYIAYDARVQKLPAWLSSWTKTDLVLETSDSIRGLYYKNFAKGADIHLGGNHQQPSRGAESNYTVILKRTR